MFMLCSTARIWPNRDIVSSRCHVAGLSPSLPTAPPPMARTSARKAGVLDRGARLPVRDGLSAGGRWIRTPGTAARTAWDFRNIPASRVALAPARVMLAAACAAGVFNASQLIARVRDAVSSTPCGATLPAVAEIVEIVDDGLARLPVITSGF